MKVNAEEKQALATQYFEQGYNCAQSVVATYAEEMGMSDVQVLKMSAGFGGGVGRMREVCGAFSGIVFVVSTLYGYEDPAEKSAFYKEIQDLAEIFKSKNECGSIVCKELMGLKKPEGTWVAEERTPQYYHTRVCSSLVKNAAVILAEYINNK